MYIGLILLFLLTTLINSDVVSGSAFQLQHTQDAIQHGETGEAVFNKGRSLRAQVQTNEDFNQDHEERFAIAGLGNKLSSGVKTWAKNKQFEFHLKKMALFTTNYDVGARTLLNEGITPDVYFKTLKLYKSKNQFVSLNPRNPDYKVWSAEYRIWDRLKDITEGTK